MQATYSRYFTSHLSLPKVKLVNEWYCEDLSENVTAALIAKKQKGQYLGHWCTYGYELDPNDRHKITVDPIAAKVVQEIYQLYLSGYGVASIANILTEKHYMTPTSHKQSKGIKYYNPSQNKGAYSSKYGIWAVNTIRRILRDETYIGSLVQSREKKVSYKSKKVIKRPREEWIIVKNNHEPIIDEDTFFRVQKRLGIKSSSCKPQTGEAPKAHILAGKVICMDCGSPMYKRCGKKDVQYLKCALALKTKNSQCSLHTVRMDEIAAEIEGRIKKAISDYLQDKKNRNKIHEALFNQFNPKDELKAKRNQLRRLSARRSELSEAMKNAYMDKVNNILSPGQLKAILEALEKETAQNERETEEAQEAILKLESKLSGNLALPFQTEHLINFERLTHEIAGDFIDYIEVGEKTGDGAQALSIHWNF